MRSWGTRVGTSASESASDCIGANLSSSLTVESLADSLALYQGHSAIETFLLDQNVSNCFTTTMKHNLFV